MRPNAETALATDAHSLDSVLEPWNHSPLTKPKGRRLVFLHLIATVEKEIVSHIHDTTWFGRRSITEHEILVLDSTPTSGHRLAAQRCG
jgi:hypothetical protein